MNEFIRDDKWQREMRDKILGPSFYRKYSVEGRYVFIDKGVLASQIQREFAVDTILQSKDGRAVCIEEKIVRWPKRDRPHQAYALETKSCTVPGYEKPGWMHYGQADFLFYCFASKNESRLTCHLIKFSELQKWFWPNHNCWPIWVSEQKNKTECRIVPIDEVEAAVGFHRYVVYAPFEAFAATG